MDLLGDRLEGISSGMISPNCSSKDIVKGWFEGEGSGSSMVVRIHSLKSLNS